MFHVTRCPNCRTSFRVTDAHLTAFDGKVRCGRCAFVFDARSHFVGDAAPETDKPASPATPSRPPQAAHSAAVVSAMPRATEREDDAYGLDSMASQLEAAAEVEDADLDHSLASQSLQQLASALAAHPTPAPAPKLHAHVNQGGMLELDLNFPPLGDEPLPKPTPAVSPAPSTPLAEPEEEVIHITAPSVQEDLSPEAFEHWAQQLNAQSEAQLAATLAPTLEEAPPPALEPAALEGTGTYRPILTKEDEELLRVPQAPSPWRWLWSLPALLAAVLLLGQLTLRYRTELAIQLPGMQPRLERLCELAGCTMELPARAELLRTEWNELIYVPEQKSLIQLNATLRNQARFDQALPLLELTLTDDSERIVARKVFGPDEYLAPQADGKPTPLPAALAAGADLRVFLQLDLGEMKSSGYSLYWFYPEAN
ncbi:DUF3426 domain-containing protein [Chitinimonas taiwanensis]|uniref:MJ0042 family finger-like domain-containing protein n=1 Tax=Chitinimonas taiwanensis DSM 18899 TaxID=1121279 RepID=A0A1K2HG17_9NEIS|nr:DUF3426 domain-containing protein [Chitinimonas taiwanensis]SFZ75667.1 MJ0042 family finger-like domain-containing protein [Chitinimonas taiwanensis DSM 18899]